MKPPTITELELICVFKSRFIKLSTLVIGTCYVQDCNMFLVHFFLNIMKYPFFILFDYFSFEVHFCQNAAHTLMWCLSLKMNFL